MLSGKVVWRDVMEANIPKKTFGRQPYGKLVKYLPLCTRIFQRRNGSSPVEDAPGWIEAPIDSATTK